MNRRYVSTAMMIVAMCMSVSAPDESQPLSPTPGLQQVDTLIEEFESSGLLITTRLDGALDDLPAAIDLAGYRLIHEALTNAQKHGSEQRAHVWLEHHETKVRIVVTNPAADAPGPPGHGLLGMRERVAAVGGELHAGRECGTFRLETVLPLHARSDGSE